MGTLNLINKGPDFEMEAENNSQISRKKYESMASRALQLGATQQKLMESMMTSIKISETARKTTSKKISQKIEFSEISKMDETSSVAGSQVNSEMPASRNFKVRAQSIMHNTH